MSESQENIILNHLKKHKHITTWEAITKYRITRLSARIFELRENGHQIISKNLMVRARVYCPYHLVI